MTFTKMNHGYNNNKKQKNMQLDHGNHKLTMVLQHSP